MLCAYASVQYIAIVDMCNEDQGAAYYYAAYYYVMIQYNAIVVCSCHMISFCVSFHSLYECVIESVI